MKKRYVLPYGYFADFAFLAVSNEDENQWVGCDTEAEATSTGLERWGIGGFEVVKCVVADGEKISWILGASY